MDHRPRGGRTQPAIGRCVDPVGGDDGGDRSVGQRQKLADRRHPVPRDGPAAAPRPAASRQARRDRGAASHRQGHPRRSIAVGQQSHQHAGDVHRRVRPDPPGVRPRAGSGGAEVHRADVLVQRPRRSLRDVRGQRTTEDRNALPARRLGAVRGLRRTSVRPGGVGGEVPRPIDRRRIGNAGRRSVGIVLRAQEDRRRAADVVRRRVGLRHPGSTRPDAVRRRGPAGQTGLGVVPTRHRPDAVPVGRTDDRAALRRHHQTAFGHAPADGPGQHGRRHRTQLGRHQERRLDHRHGPRGGRPRRQRRVHRNAGRDGHVPGFRNRVVRARGAR